MKRGKKYVEAAKLVEKSKAYDVKEALDLACKTSTAKFDASVDVSFRVFLANDPDDRVIR